MGIREIIQNTGNTRRACENFEITRPILNFFLGDFADKEKTDIIGMVKNRVGETRRIHFCEFILGKAEKTVCDKHICIDYSEDELFNSLTRDTKIDFTRIRADEFRSAVDSYITEVFNESSTEVYSASGQVRINVIVNSDSIASILVSDISDTIKDSLIGLYPNGVYVDIYCMLDQRVIAKEQNGNNILGLRYYLLKTLNEYAGCKNTLVYILSNYTSEKVLISDVNVADGISERYRCMILNMFIKDGNSVYKEGAPIFNEKDFIESTEMCEGRFYSLGDCKLEPDIDSRNYSVIKSVLNDIINDCTSFDGESVALSLGISVEDIINKIQLICREHGWIEIDNEVWALVRNQGDNVQGRFLSDQCKILISDLYEDRLDLFWEKNSMFSETDIRAEVAAYAKSIISRTVQKFTIGDFSFPAMISLFRFFSDGIREYNQKNTEALESAQKALISFLDKRIMPNDKKDSFSDEPIIIKKLVCEYFEAKRTIEFHRRLRFCIDEICGVFDNYAKDKQNLFECIEKATGDLSDMINENVSYNISHDLEILSGNIEYYSNITEELITQDTGLYAEWKKGIFRRIADNSIGGEELLENVYAFCRDSLFVLPQYNLPFSEEILKRLHNYKQRYDTEDSIHEFAYETFLKQRKYYAHHSTFGVVVDVICFLVNPDNKFFDATNERVKQKMDGRQMKVFLENNYDGMDILYLEGRFNWESIYQLEIYRSAYEKIRIGE